MLQMSSPQVSAICPHISIFPHMSAIDLCVKICKLQHIQELPFHQVGMPKVEVESLLCRA